MFDESRYALRKAHFRPNSKSQQVASESCRLLSIINIEKGRPLPKFGEWDVNDPTSAEGFTVIFNKARDEKKTGGNPDSPGKTATDPHSKPAVEPGKTQTVRCS
ncbi:Protein NOI4 [Glycine soja]|uniref:Protein NOI4 n=1 Tax=Glycine soja TaxID=3848 RepID=A0A445G8V9_GLYSO|nr:Protein NOI4 [Glycine soja]